MAVGPEDNELAVIVPLFHGAVAEDAVVCGTGGEIVGVTVVLDTEVDRHCEGKAPVKKVETAEGPATITSQLL